MSECKMFKHGLTIMPGGNIKPCCLFRSDKTLTIDSNWKEKFSEYDAISKRDWISPGCDECRILESSGYDSLRKTYNKKLKDAGEGILYLDLKINNTCNLACRMCNPQSSSKWVQILEKNSHESFDDYFAYFNNKKWWKDIDKIEEIIKDVKYIKFTGGEPFLIPQVKKIVTYLVENNLASQVTLRITSNATVDITDWWPLFEKFKKVELTFSIDAVGDLYEYIRPGAKWNDVDENITLIDQMCIANTDIRIFCLEMALNYNNIENVRSWVMKFKNISTFYHDILTEPEYFSVKALSDPHLKKKMIEQLEIQDRVHGTNWRDFIDA